MNETIIRAIIENYSKMSNEDLMVELAKHMSRQREADGGANMAKTIERIKPLLNAEQKKRLEEVLASVAKDTTKGSV